MRIDRETNRIDIILDDKEAALLIAVLSSQLAGIILMQQTNYNRPNDLVSSDDIKLTLSVIPTMAYTKPGDDPPDTK